MARGSRGSAPVCGRVLAPALVVVALLATGCVFLRSTAKVGPLEQHEFTVDAGDATDADLHVAFWGGEITVAPAQGDERDDPVLYLATADNLDQVDPRCEQRREGRHVSARLYVDTDHNLSLDDDQRNEWTLALGRRVPLVLDLGLATCEGTIDLGGVPLRRARVSVGAGKATLRFSRPNPVELEELRIELGAGQFEVADLGNARARSISVDAGAGEFKIGCHGEWKGASLLRVEAGMAGVTIRVPRELDVRVDARDTTFGSVSAPDFTSEGDERYRSRDPAADAPRLALEVEARFGSVTIVRE